VSVFYHMTRVQLTDATLKRISIPLMAKTRITLRAFCKRLYSFWTNTSRCSREVYRTSSVIKQLGKKGATLSSVTLSLTLAKEFLREALTIKQLRIEIWTPEGGKKTASKYNLTKQVRKLEVAAEHQ
jgi:hypothetical protein